MRMVPNFPYETFSQAEKRIFDRLRRAFDEQYLACHSLKPPGNSRKRFPEIDFVICGPEGLYVLEIKGGGVACRDGVWRFEDRYGRMHESQEGPFRQAETALRALTESIRADFADNFLDAFTVGYGLVFPDCDFSSYGAEWDPALVADARESRDLEGWLVRLFRHWRDLDGRGTRTNKAALRRLQEYLRPNIDAPLRDAAVPLSNQVQGVRWRTDHYTEDQMRMVDVAEANQRVVCAGGAGTGKTFLAERLSRRWAEAGLEVALVCRSAWLRHFLAARLSVPNVTVSQIDSVRLDCRRKGIARFDALIVDEGQDLFEMRCLETLDRVIGGGLDGGRWCWFHDVNNQSISHRFERGAMERLLSLDPVHMPLGINCRNTRVILEWIQRELDADLGVRGVGEGPAVRRQAASSRSDAADRLAQEITELVDVGGLAPGDLTILSPHGFTDSSVAKLSGDAAKLVQPLDEFSMRQLRGDKVGFARIDDFKGLENEAIIVVDLPAPDLAPANRTYHYVAMSRARSVLSLIQWESFGSSEIDPDPPCA